MAYKLFYFNGKGIAEPIRFLLSYGKADFEEVRFEFADWPKYKDSMPMGTVPVLEVGGKQLHQSVSICRFLANKFGLAGKTAEENYEIDTVVDTVNDLKTKIAMVHWEANPEVQAEQRKTLNAETIPFYLNKLDIIAKNNNGHLALKRLTWADLYFTALAGYMNFAAKMDLVEKHVNLKKVTENVNAIESIKNWIAKRPKTDL